MDEKEIMIIEVTEGDLNKAIEERSSNYLVDGKPNKNYCNICLVAQALNRYNKRIDYAFDGFAATIDGVHYREGDTLAQDLALCFDRKEYDKLREMLPVTITFGEFRKDDSENEWEHTND